MIDDITLMRVECPACPEFIEGSKVRQMAILRKDKTVWYVYILKCSDNSFYTGHTNNLSERLKRHNDGRGSSHTATRLPVKLIWHEEHQNETAAMKREMQIKKWSRAKKLALINGDMQKLKLLSKSKNSIK